MKQIGNNSPVRATPRRRSVPLAILLLVVSCSSYGQQEARQPRQAERLDRGLVAVLQGDGNVVLSWRMLGLDPESIRFDLYRQLDKGPAVKLNARPLSATHFVDKGWGAKAGATWRVVGHADGLEDDVGGMFSLSANVPPRPYLNIPLQRPAGGTTPDGVSYSYTANDANVGDLDGDGDYEIILRWEPENSWGGGHGTYTGPVLIDAYTMEGKRLWRIDLGTNVNASAHITQMTVYDLDGDGRAEIALLAADGTVDGAGKTLGNAKADYRESNGAVLKGREYLTVFDGLTGAARVGVAGADAPASPPGTGVGTDWRTSGRSTRSGIRSSRGTSARATTRCRSPISMGTDATRSCTAPVRSTTTARGFTRQASATATPCT